MTSTTPQSDESSANRWLWATLGCFTASSLITVAHALPHEVEKRPAEQPQHARKALVQSLNEIDAFLGALAKENANVPDEAVRAEFPEPRMQEAFRQWQTRASGEIGKTRAMVQGVRDKAAGEKPITAREDLKTLEMLNTLLFRLTMDRDVPNGINPLRWKKMTGDEQHAWEEQLAGALKTSHHAIQLAREVTKQPKSQAQR